MDAHQLPSGLYQTSSLWLSPRGHPQGQGASAQGWWNRTRGRDIPASGDRDNLQAIMGKQLWGAVPMCHQQGTCSGSRTLCEQSQWHQVLSMSPSQLGAAISLPATYSSERWQQKPQPTTLQHLHHVLKKSPCSREEQEFCIREIYILIPLFTNGATLVK